MSCLYKVTKVSLGSTINFQLCFLEAFKINLRKYEGIFHIGGIRNNVNSLNMQVIVQKTDDMLFMT